MVNRNLTIRDMRGPIDSDDAYVILCKARDTEEAYNERMAAETLLEERLMDVISMPGVEEDVANAAHERDNMLRINQANYAKVRERIIERARQDRARALTELNKANSAIFERFEIAQNSILYRAAEKMRDAS